MKVANQKLTQEEFLVLQHDKNYNVISCESIFKGGLDRSTVDLKTILPKILQKGVEGISIAHNHPSGNPNPSRADIEITNTLEKVCKKFNKALLDHYIVSSTKIFSFLKEGLIDDKYLKNLKNIKDKTVLAEIIKKDWSKIKYVNPDFIEKKIAIKAISDNAFAFEYISDKLKKDREIVLTAIKNRGSLFDDIDTKYHKDKEIIENVLKNGNNLVLLDEKYRNNLEIVKIAIKNNPESIEYASKELQEKLSREKENPWKKKIENSKSKGLGR